MTMLAIDPSPRAPTDAGRGDQADVIAWLSTPVPYGGHAVERIDTHSAVVFLAGDRAFKLKRAVRYDYLDFSTSERRYHACLDELALNRRTAPTLYRAVRAITREPDGSLALDGHGPAVDWLIEMTRFDQDTLLTRLADRHALDLALMPTLADAVARLHRLAEWRVDHGGRAGMMWVIRGNRDGFEQFGDTLGSDAWQRITAQCLALVERHTRLLESRRRLGFVRRGHGDLHLGNVCLVDGVPTPFDGVEFNDEISCVDVLYDLAFLLMDLWYRGLTRHAHVVLNRYLGRTGDIDGLALLPLFQVTRAAVRAKTSVTAARVQPDAGTAAGLRDDARRYLALAAAFLDPAPARLLAIGGVSGTGKSSLALELGPDIGPSPGALVLRSDAIRKEHAGVDPRTRLGREGYDEAASRQVYRTVASRASRALAAGHGVIVDAVLQHPADRETLAAVARENGVPFTGLWLTGSRPTLETRLRARVGDVSDATPDVLARQLAETRMPAGWAVIDTDRDRELVGRRARALLGIDQAK